MRQEDNAMKQCVVNTPFDVNDVNKIFPLSFQFLQRNNV